MLSKTEIVNSIVETGQSATLAAIRTEEEIDMAQLLLIDIMLCEVKSKGMPTRNQKRSITAHDVGAAMVDVFELSADDQILTESLELGFAWTRQVQKIVTLNLLRNIKINDARFYGDIANDATAEIEDMDINCMFMTDTYSLSDLLTDYCMPCVKRLLPDALSSMRAIEAETCDTAN